MPGSYKAVKGKFDLTQSTIQLNQAINPNKLIQFMGGSEHV
jgi:hypothetical protein